MRGMGTFLRDNIEAFAVAIAMALVIRHYCVEAFRIPTGSMMPTLYGDGRLDEAGRVRHGDRILVDKFAWMRDDPRRWQVMVFQYPLNRNKNYIKRLIGLPDEWLAIADGDIWTSADGDTWTIERKPPGVRDQLMLPYWPTPQDADGFAGKSVWRGDDAWTAKGDRFTVDAGEAPSSLRFERRVFTYPNVDERGGSVGSSVKVGDIRFRAEVEVEREGVLEVRIEEHGVTHRLVLGPDKSFLEVGGTKPAQRDLEFRVESGDSFDLSFANVDDSLALVLDGDEFLFPFPDQPTMPPGLAPDFGGGNGDEGEHSLALLASDIKATLTDARVERDLHYVRYNGDPSPEKWQIPAGHYFALGDNTNSSKDSRAWEMAQVTLQDGTVIGWEPRDPTTPGNATAGELRGMGPDEVFVIAEDKDGLYREFRVSDVAETKSKLPRPFIPSDHLIGRAFGVFWPIYVPPVYRGATRIQLIR
jgi:signal peptidase I